MVRTIKIPVKLQKILDIFGLAERIYFKPGLLSGGNSRELRLLEL